MNNPRSATISLPPAMILPNSRGQLNESLMYVGKLTLHDSAILSYNSIMKSLFHSISPASTCSLTQGHALKYTESVSPYITLLPK